MTSDSDKLPSGFSASSWARVSMLFSGVRNSWDMPARMSDLRCEVAASTLAFSPSSTCERRSSAWLRRSSLDQSCNCLASRRESDSSAMVRKVASAKPSGVRGSFARPSRYRPI